MENSFSESGYEYSPFGHPESPGVYVVCMGELIGNQKAILTPVYIGASKNISKRVLTPTHPYRVLFDMFCTTHIICVAVKETEDYYGEEIRMIKKWNPKYNKQHNG